MKEYFVSFELAKKLKEKGYPQRTFGNYDMVGSTYFQDGRHYKDGCICNKNDAYTAPTISEALTWLREEQKLHVVCPFYKDQGYYFYVQSVGNAARIVSSFDDSDDCFDSFESAASKGIEYVLDNLIK